MGSDIIATIDTLKFMLEEYKVYKQQLLDMIIELKETLEPLQLTNNQLNGTNKEIVDKKYKTIKEMIISLENEIMPYVDNKINLLSKRVQVEEASSQVIFNL